MKNIRNLLFLLILFCIAACKHKVSHNEALSYYVTVSLQTQAAASDVKNFSSYLTKFLKKHPIDKSINDAAIDSFKQANSSLTKQINNRLVVLNDLKPLDNEFILKFWSIHFIKHTQQFFYFSSKYISTYKFASFNPKQKMLFKANYISLKNILNADASFIQKYSNKFIREYNITEDELAKYNLK